MKISVVIPCYNAGPWVLDALRSVAEQTYRPHEIIFVDDGSTDDSVQKIVSTGIGATVLHTDRINAAAARNVGVEAATGDWIAFLDADDLWYPQHLQRGAELLRAGNDVAYLAHNDQIRFAERAQGVVIHRNTTPPVQAPTPGLSDLTFFEWHARVGWFCTNGLIAKRNDFIRIGGFDPRQVRRHDFEMFLRLIHQRTWAYDPQPTSVYRFLVNPKCISRNMLETRYYTLRALIKNQDLYCGPVMRGQIRRWARTAMMRTLVEDEGDFAEKVRDLAWSHLSTIERAAYRLAKFVPWLIRPVHDLRQRVRRAVG